MKESDISESDDMTENDGESTEIDESTNEDKVANADDDWLDVENLISMDLKVLNEICHQILHHSKHFH